MVIAMSWLGKSISWFHSAVGKTVFEDFTCRITHDAGLHGESEW